MVISIESTNTNGVVAEKTLKELNDLINWNSHEEHDKTQSKRLYLSPKNSISSQSIYRKRETTSKEEQQEKHKTAEKRRRDEMNEVIERLKSLLPASDKEKMTKVTILQDTSEYLFRIQVLAARLLQENKNLKSALQSQSSNAQTMRGSSPVSSDSAKDSAETSKKRKITPDSSTKSTGRFIMDGSRVILVFFTYILLINFF